MKKKTTPNELILTVRIPISAEKRRAIELYYGEFLPQMQREIQTQAEQILSQMYSKKVPKNVREYIALCAGESNGESEKTVTESVENLTEAVESDEKNGCAE